MVLLHPADVVAETAGVEVVVAARLDKLVFAHDVVEANGAGASGDVGLGQELLGHVDDLEQDGGAGGGVLRAAGFQRGEEGGEGTVQKATRVPNLISARKRSRKLIKEKRTKFLDSGRYDELLMVLVMMY